MRIGWEWWYLWAKVTTDHSPRWLPDIYTESLPTSQYTFIVSTWNHFRCPSDCTKQSGEHFHTVTVTIYCELLPCLDSIYGLVWIAGQIPTLNSNHLHRHCMEKQCYITFIFSCCWKQLQLDCNGRSSLSGGCNGLVFWCVLKHWWKQLQFKWLVMVRCGFGVVLSK